MAKRYTAVVGGGFSGEWKHYCDGWYWYGNGDVNDSHVWNGRMAGISGTKAGMGTSIECWNAAYLEATLD